MDFLEKVYQNIQEFKYYFNNSDKILDIKNEKHNNNDSINYQLIFKFTNFANIFYK